MGIAEDLDRLLGEKTSHGMPSAQPIQKLRTTHLELARLLALGLKDVEISRITGYSQSRICILKADPMFANLVSHYAVQRDEGAIDISRRLRDTSIVALEVLQERLEDDPDSITVRDLAKVAELGLDRVGFGKTTKVETSTLVRTQTLAEIRLKIESEHKGRVLPRDIQLGRSEEASVPAELYPPALPAPGGQGQGDGLRAEGPGAPDEPLAGGPA